MKNVSTSLTAMMLVIWYSLSVIGFGVHTCSGSGQTYIATVASGFTCEDIHPEHGHSACGCCHTGRSEADRSFDRKPCCTDEYHVIALTGVRGEDDNDDDLRGFAFLGHEIHVLQHVSGITQYGLKTFHKPRQGGTLSRDVLASYNIWRI